MFEKSKCYAGNCDCEYVLMCSVIKMLMTHSSGELVKTDWYLQSQSCDVNGEMIRFSLLSVQR